MKPNFALNLTDDAIGLLHRTSRGWMDIGSTPLDAPDLAEALGYLRASALGLSPQGMTTKVVIPNSQILYTEVDAPGPDAASRKAQIRAALEGRTPYAVDDLVFDWWGKGPRVQVAVIARETLQEAEDFATAHRFNPVSFVAIPEPGRFTGEPWFGQTSAAARLLAAGETVTRDQDPIQIIARDTARDEATPAPPAPAAAAPAAPRPSAAPVPAATPAAPAPAAPPVPQPATPTPAAPAAPPADAAAPKPAAPTAAEPKAEAPAATPASVAPQAPPADAAAPKPAAQTAAEPKAAAPAATPASVAPQAPAAPPADAAAPRPAAPAAPRPDAARDASASPSGTAQPLREGPARPDAAADKPPAAPVVTAAGVREPAPATPSFSSRRRDDTAAPPTLGPAEGRTPAAPPVTAPPVAAPPAAAPRAVAPDRSTPPPVTAAAAPPPVPPAPKPAAPAAAAKAPPPPPRPEVKPVAKPLAPPKPVSGGVERPVPKAQALAAITANGTATAPRKGAAQPARPAGDPLAAGRGARPRGKPRYLGLVLTGVLLLFLALVAAWSSIYLSNDDTAADPATDVAALPQAAPDGSIVAPDAIAVAPEPMDPEMAADLAAIDAEPPAEGQTPIDALPPAAVATPDPAAVLPAPAAEAPAPAQTAAAPAAPEPAPEPAAEPAPAAAAQLDGRSLVVPGPEGQDEIFLAAMDAPPPAFDALALPVPLAAADPAPVAPVPPPPPGEVYEFDAEGRIVPTERGVVTPGGFWLIAARPDILPPPRPASLAAPAAPAESDAATDAAADAAIAAAAEPAATDGAFQPDPAFAGSRPRPRPAGLVPPPAPADPVQAEDDASAAPPVDPRFAAIRPRERPLTVVARAEEARRATEAASLAVAAATAAAPQGWDPNASPLAVSMSRRPAPRPADMTRVVAAAAAAAVRPAEPPPAADPEEEDEPEVASVAPSIPTRASVAKQATFVNAINLSRLNLIGIYGTPSSRYALVRSSNGRYSKVEVGDRLDGGTVAAITASELRYQKGGRMLVLEMPRG